MGKLIETKGYEELINNIGSVYDKAKTNVVSAINVEMLKAYWEIGRFIVEFEQNGNIKATYGKELLVQMSKDLSVRYGKGFSRSNLTYMRQFYYKYPKCETLSHKLTWSHYFELLKIDDDLARNFYQKQAISENWTVRELKRQKQSGLFHRLALNQDKEKILELAKEGQIVKTPHDLTKDPYVFEFLGIPEKSQYSESDIENAIINNLQSFLLELGKGFAFIGKQKRITLNNRHYYVDLVFYHVKLKCYVLVDLKIGEVEYEHIGQMKLYLGYFEKEVNDETDNQPIGIILSEEKDEIMVEYAMLNDNANLLVSKYQLLLPNINELKEGVKAIIDK
ncbi:MAG TPA: PDDEXK nuclease domain-containing protein [Bacteroidales bacterium]|nr:PDDEXK nuclease domain-containing protein [Bacteroidales bacterium]HOH21858.1 PDDEXK nuclease domain-containing protein [Bacteroidales bacterium]HPB57190.1 PDDEXK nuclease domain-containing protein [Bacteroidales bacterium]HPZ02754.1 PDDEXK nuclease domain-containing protein [Bacteroidales bacterium]HQB74346.1 PDDEXK nuclease domain-containing protein [Bacteroidales bacterium]